MVLGALLVTFGDLLGTFSDFCESRGQARNLMIFKGSPGRAQVERTHKLG